MSRRIYALLAVAAAVGLVLAIVALAGNGSSQSESDPSTDLEFEVAELRDLEEVTTLDGTLGFPDGESIVSRRQGTMTDVVSGGTVATEGTVLFEVDDDPVVLLLGPSPAYRDLGEMAVTASVAAGRPGTVTAVPETETVIEPGAELFRIDDVPVVLLPGDLPFWRNLRRGSEGADVLQLESALVALGYDPDGTIVVDDSFTAGTEALVRTWQESSGLAIDGGFTLGDAYAAPSAVTVLAVHAAVGDSVAPGAPILAVEVGSEPMDGPDVLQLQEALVRLGFDSPTSGVLDQATTPAIVAWQLEVGADPDGIVDLGEVVFLPEPVRITQALLATGSPLNNGSPVLATSASASVVLVDLPASNQDLLEVGLRLDVEMPDGSFAAGEVTEISGIATRLGSGDVVFETTIHLLDTTASAVLDQAPVDVLVVTDSRDRVLAVPVTALVALAEGGYAVEVDRGGGFTALVAVAPGLYADGWVEIATDGLSAGDRVVVP